MASEVTMPRLSDSMEEGTILKWLVSEGDEVSRGQDLVEIETDKANMTYEADTDGTLVEIVAQEGDTLPIGEPIARIGDAGEAPSGGGEEASEGEDEAEDGEGERQADGGDQDGAGAQAEAGGEEDGEDGEPAGDAGAEEAAEGTRATGQATAGEGEEAARGGDGASVDGDSGRSRGGTATDGADGRIKASPVAKRVASDLGVELTSIEGSGPGGRIVKADVEAAAERAPAEQEAPERAAEGDGEKPAEDEGAADEERKPSRPATPEPEPAGDAGAKGELMTQELTRLQQTVSRRMAESKATAPDYALTAEIDMTACVELRGRLKEVADPAPSFNDMVVKACATALREFPRVNGAYRDGRFERYSRVNVGVAVAAQDTLVVPTLFDADQRSLGDIARKGRELIGKVREASITPPELSGGTFTVSNLGMYGIDSFSGVINPPQAALLAVGALKKKPVIEEESGRIVARDMMSVTLVCDHRILYGADGAQFLARVRELLEQPLSLAL
jgi:pyruvate dehydrogenase E2 component (dihydrolipoamide acetyltransferase)